MLHQLGHNAAHGIRATHGTTSWLKWRSRAGTIALMAGLVVGSVSAIGGAAPATAAAGATGWAQISAGWSQTCALTDSGAAWCWGSDAAGGLGNGGTNIDSDVPVAVVGGHTFSQISLGVAYACGLEASTGTAWCWGANAEGQLGNGNVGTDSSVPVAVTGGHTFSRLSAGAGHACAIEAGTGAAWCWGGADERLGDGDAGTDGSVPVAVSGGKSWSQITTGFSHTCGIESGTDAAWCWGFNGDGQLGHAAMDSAVPVTVSGDKEWSQLSAGRGHTCGIEAGTGSAWCWGDNYFGQLGNGDSGGGSGSELPVAVAGNKAWSQLTTGFGQTCGVEAATDTAWCWGSNGDGVLGNGQAGTDSALPVAVSGNKAWTQLSTGFGLTCGIEAVTGAAWCWGGNYYGELGDGNTGTGSGVPVRVSLLPQSVTFDALADAALPTVPWDVSGDVSSSSGLPVTVTSTSPSVCTVSGMSVTLVAAGTCVLSASQPGDGAFAAAESVDQNFAVTSAAPPDTTPATPTTIAPSTPTTLAPAPTTPPVILVAVPQAPNQPNTAPTPSALATTGGPIAPATGAAIALIGLGAALNAIDRRRARRTT